jgi:hypothetical protein
MLITTDAAGSVGADGYSQATGEWLYLPFRAHHARSFSKTDTYMGIVWKELYAVVICAAILGHAWEGTAVCIQSAVEVYGDMKHVCGTCLCLTL